VALDPRSLEDEKVAGAIKTDFILSAEIMAITLAAVPSSTIWTQALVLAVVGVGITAAVYGVVALIVKADDAGVALAGNRAASAMGAASRALGRTLVRGMPGFLTFISIAGTAAMIWVGGGIMVHGLEHYGLTLIGHAIHAAGEWAAHALPTVGGFVEWMVTAALSGVFGLLIGALSIPLAGYVIAPAWKRVKAVLPRRRRVA
jgi:predicted DNA repair protein MutK